MNSIPVKQRPIRIFGKAHYSEEECKIRLSEEMQVVRKELDKYFGGRKNEHPDYLLRYLTVFPEICQDYTESIVGDELAFETVSMSAFALYYTLIGDYRNAAEKVEERLVTQGNGELVVSLIEWALQNSQELAARPETYYSVVQEDPFQARRLELILKNWGLASTAKRITARTIRWCRENKDTASAAAYIYVCSNPTIPIREYIKIIQKNPFYAYRGLISLWHRKFNLHEMDYNRISPRWAYHLLRIGGERVDSDMLREVLCQDPGWATEYLFDSEKYANPTILKQWSREMRDLDPEHPLFNHYLAWMQSATEHSEADEPATLKV